MFKQMILNLVVSAIDITEGLTYFNLTKQEATIYLTLCTEGELTGYEVAKLTGISRSNAYISLAALVEKGAAYIVEGAATRYTPVEVGDFCENRIKQLQRIKGDLIKKIPGKRDEADGYITIKGQKHIMDKMRNMLMEARERVYLSLSANILDGILRELQDGVARGLKVVIITNKSFSLLGATVYHAETSQDQIRLIVDSNNVLTGDLIDGDYSTCLYSKKKNLVDLFKDALKNEITLIELKKGT